MHKQIDNHYLPKDAAFTGKSEMHRHITEFNWQDSKLGPIPSWPQSLRSAVHIMLGSHYPMAIWWGEEMIMFNNDAYSALMGKRQPASLGQPAKLMWSDIWEAVGPMFEKILTQGEAWFADKLLLYNERKGFREEAYFTFSCNPIIKEDGTVGGIFCTSSEDTRQVLSERRLDMLRHMGTISVESGNVELVKQHALRILTKNKQDIPFALVVRLSGQDAFLTAFTEDTFIKDFPAQPAFTDNLLSQLEQVYTEAKPVVIKDLTDLTHLLATPPHGVMPNMALASPLLDAGHGKVTGCLITGISPVLEYDEHYEDYLNLVTSHFNATLDNARALEQEKLRTEKLLELDEAKTTFFSNISHEFRTPITLMLGPTEELLERDVFTDEEDKVRLQTVQRNGLRLLKQVNHLLNFSSLESGRLKAAYCPVDLPAYTYELCSTFTSVMQHAGLGFTVTCDQVKEPVYIDPEMWEKIIFNLLSNAFKYTLEGEVTIRLADGSDHVQLIVEDTGLGIAEEELPHLFSRFHKIKNNCGRSYEGSGIGLSMVAELVKMHYGSLTVESTLGKGSRFTVNLRKGKTHLAAESIKKAAAPVSYPFEKSTKNPYLIEASSWLLEKPENLDYSALETDPEHSRSKYTVLLVDDNKDMQAYMSRLLKPDYRIVTATNGLEALQMLLSHSIDIVLSDSMMPKMDGLTLVQEIRKHPKLGAIPIILISAQAGDNEKLKGISHGADDYMTKPFSARELSVRVKSQLYVAKLRKEASQREHKLLIEAQQLKEELDDVLTNMNDAFIVLDHDLRYTYINDKAGKFTNRTQKDFLGKLIWDVFPELVGSFFYEKVLEAKASVRESNFEMYYATLEVWYDIRIYPYKDGLTMYICDITGKKLEEQARLETEARFKVMADAAPVLIWISAHGSEPVYFNKSWLEYRGHTLEEEQNRGWLQGVHPDDLTKLYAVYEAASEQKESYELEMRLMGANGEYHWFLNKGVPLFMPDGSSRGYIGACIDITKRKWAEELLSKYNRDLEERVAERTSALQQTNQLLEQQIAERKKTEESLSRSHEQMRSLTSHLQVMREEERKYIARELHDELGQAFTALKIDVTLLLKKLAAGKSDQDALHEELQSMMQTINSSITSVREIVATLRPAVLDNFGLLSEIESQAQDFLKRTSIAVAVKADIPYIALDKEAAIEVFRIVQECMTNIARHAQASEVTIQVNKTATHFCFTVADNGKGIQKGNLTDVRTFGLLGMHERAQRIGATLTFKSKTNQGTRVMLEVPI